MTAPFLQPPCSFVEHCYHCIIYVVINIVIVNDHYIVFRTYCPALDKTVESCNIAVYQTLTLLISVGSIIKR